jgi:quercetin dioxygenase-like cupin family protein
MNSWKWEARSIWSISSEEAALAFATADVSASIWQVGKKGVPMKVIRAMEMKKSRRGGEAPRKDEDCREGEEHFEGNVWSQAMLPSIRPSQLRANLITFEPETRTNWHKHPDFQILYVVAGKGRIRCTDGAGNEGTFEIAAGDLVHIGTEKHWHGAAPDSFMIHIAINTGETCWMGKVQDEEYMRGI